MARKSRTSRRKSLSRFDWLGIPDQLMTERVMVVPKLGAHVVKGSKLAYGGYPRIKVERVRPERRKYYAKPTMAEIVAAVAVKGGSKTHVEPLAKKLTVVPVNPKAIHVLGMLVAASAISYCKSLPEAVAMGDGVLNSIANTPFDVEVSSSGRVTTRVGRGRALKRETIGRHETGVRIEVGDHVSVSKGKGTTVYHFDSLNIYFTAELIKEVNIDSERVIGFLTDQLSDMTDAVKQKIVEVENVERLEEPDEVKDGENGDEDNPDQAVEEQGENEDDKEEVDDEQEDEEETETKKRSKK